MILIPYLKTASDSPWDFAELFGHDKFLVEYSKISGQSHIARKFPSFCIYCFLQCTKGLVHFSVALLTDIHQMKCVAYRAGEPTVTDSEMYMLQPQIPEWQVKEV